MEALELKQRLSLLFLVGLVCLSPFIYDLLAWVKPVF